MLKILLTGANGYLGKGVVKQLLDDGIEVVATDYKDNLVSQMCFSTWPGGTDLYTTRQTTLMTFPGIMRL